METSDKLICATYFNESDLTGCECFCDFLFGLKAAGKLSDLSAVFCLCPLSLPPVLSSTFQVRHSSSQTFVLLVFGCRSVRVVEEPAVKSAHLPMMPCAVTDCAAVCVR